MTGMMNAIVLERDVLNGLSTGDLVFIPPGALHAASDEGFIPVIMLDGRCCWAPWDHLQITNNLVDQK